MVRKSEPIPSACVMCGKVTIYPRPSDVNQTCSKECKSALQKTPEYQAKLQIGRDAFNADPIRKAEQARKASEANMGHEVTPETRARLAESMKNSESAKAARAKASENLRGRILTPFQKEALVKANTGRVMSKESRAKLSAAKLGTKYRPWSDAAKANVMAIRAKKGTPVFARNSKEEYAAEPYLTKLGYRHTAEKSFFVNHPDGTRKVPDFIDYPNRKVIEIWGTYWHKTKKLPEGKSHATVNEYIEWYRTAHQGPWECIVVWDHELSDFLEGLGG